MSTLTIADRNIRQRDLISEEKLKASHAMVIGIGSIGRQVALQLATIGVGKLSLVDFDTVGIENFGAQGYKPSQEGNLKVDSTMVDCGDINPDVKLNIFPSRFSPGHLKAEPTAIFCCVDDMGARKSIFSNWKASRPQARIFIDARMAAFSCRIITATPDDLAHYEPTLFSQEEAYQASCTTKSTFFCANIAAGMMVLQFAQHIRQHPSFNDIDFSLADASITVK